MKNSLDVCAKIDFGKSVDSFDVEIYCTVGKKKLDFEQVEKAMYSGLKYFSMEHLGFVEVPHTKLMILSLLLINLALELFFSISLINS